MELTSIPWADLSVAVVSLILLYLAGKSILRLVEGLFDKVTNFFGNHMSQVTKAQSENTEVLRQLVRQMEAHRDKTEGLE